MNKEILIICIGFLPNIGGLETHLADLIDELIKDQWNVIVLTYQPLQTPVLGKWIERKHHLTIYRLPVIRGWFYKFLKIPILEFLFLGPLLFFSTPVVLMLHRKICIINAQGIIAGFSASFWNIIFRDRYVISAQSIYQFPKNGLYRKISHWIFDSAEKVVAISNQSKKDISSLGIDEKKIVVYTNWENEKKYHYLNKNRAKEKLKLKNKFVVSFFGRLVYEKGITVFLSTIKMLPSEITFLIYGEGPLKNLVLEFVSNHENSRYMGTVPPEKLNLNYSAADLVVMPSLHEEGFGRVASGALLSGTPVIASSKGALPEVVNDTVGKIVDPKPIELAKAISDFYNDKNKLRKSTKNARSYALKKFGRANALPIIQSYMGDIISEFEKKGEML